MKSRFKIFRTYCWMFREWLGYRVKRSEGYNWTRCPICGHLTLTENFICPHCEWEYDNYFDDEGRSYVNGNLTIEEYKERWIKNQRSLKTKNGKLLRG